MTADQTVKDIDAIKNVIDPKDGLSFQVGVADSPDPNTDTIDTITKLLTSHLGDTRVHITVLPQADNSYLIYLSAPLSKEDFGRVYQSAQVYLQTISKQLTKSGGTPPGIALAPRDAVKDPTSDIQAMFDAALNDKRITVKLLSSEKKYYQPILSGGLSNQQEIEVVKKATQATIAVVANRFSGLTLAAPDFTGLLLTDDMVADVWPLISLGGAGAADQTVTGSIVTSVVNALNAIYGTKDHPVVVTSDGNNLWINAPRSVVLKIKGFLAMVDSSFPQVSIDVWAVQLSGNKRQVSTQMAQVQDDLNMTAERMKLVQSALWMTLKDANLYDDPGGISPFILNNILNPRASLIIRPNSVEYPFSLEESLILIGSARNRCKLVESLRCNWATLVENQKKTINKDMKDIKDQLKAKQSQASCEILKARLSNDQKQLKAMSEEEASPSFHFLGKALSEATNESDRAGVRRLINNLQDYRAFVRALGVYNTPIGANEHFQDGSTLAGLTPTEVLDRLQFAPEELARISTTVDGMLNELMTAFNADMDTIYLRPMLQRLQALPGTSSGVGLVGKTHLVVTSRKSATLAPSLVSYVNTTRPVPFNANDILGNVFPAKAGGITNTKVTDVDANGVPTTTQKNVVTKDTTGLSGTAALLATLPQGEAALLALALANDAAPVYTQVAPGISVNILPSVPPDGNSADLTIDASFGVTTTTNIENRTDVWAQQPADSVQSHKVTTHALIPGFRLFSLSSFNVSTTHPHAPFYIPVLGRLPIIGPAFQVPVPPHRVEHQSLIIMSASIVPRSLGIVGFYGAAKSGRLKDRPSDVRSDSLLPNEQFPASGKKGEKTDEKKEKSN